MGDVVCGYLGIQASMRKLLSCGGISLLVSFVVPRLPSITESAFPEEVEVGAVVC